MISKKYTIEIIQGDTFEKNVVISGVDNNDIEKVYFSSIKLKIDKELTYDSENEKWVVKMNPDETKDLEITTTDFDITIKFTNDDVMTCVYRGVIQVLPKINKVGDLNE